MSLSASAAGSPANSSTATPPGHSPEQPRVSPDVPANTSLPTVAGQLSPQTPPARTAVSHTLTLDAASPLANGTQLLLPAAYQPRDVSVRAVTAAGGATPRLVVESTPAGSARLRLATSAPVQNLTVDLRLTHPAVSEPTTKRVRLRAPSSSGTADTTVLAQYTIQPIGADRRAGPAGSFDRASGAGYVYSGATVYQGESDIGFRGALTTPLVSVGNNTNGAVLSPPIPAEAATGTYSVGGKNTTANVTVMKPRITGFRVENQRGADVSGGAVTHSGADEVSVIAQSNFEDAESLELTVTTDSGLDVTDAVINGSRVRQEPVDGSPTVISSSVSDVSSARSQPGYATHRDTTQVLAANPQLTGERTVETLDLDQGGETTVTVTATVGSSGRLGITESFSPAVRTASIKSVTVDGDPVVPTVAAADTTGVAVALQDIEPGATVVVTYTIGVPDNDQTVKLTGQVTAGSQRIQLDSATLIVGTGTRDTITAGGRVRWNLDLTQLETSKVSITVTGADDFTTANARSQTSLRIAQDPPKITVNSRALARGEQTKLTIMNGIAGSTYAVLVSRSDLRSNLSRSSYTQLFRTVGNTKRVGLFTDQETASTAGALDASIDGVYATVRIDPDTSTGITKLRTEYLASNATINLVRRPDIASNSGALDTIRLHPSTPTVSLTAPDQYTTRTETTVRGTTSQGTDAVVLYVRTEDQFELVDTDGSNGKIDARLDVSDGSFSAAEIDLSSGDAPGNTVLSVPGQYQLGIARVASLPQTATTGSPLLAIAAPEFLGEGTTTASLEVQPPNISLTRAGQNGTMSTTATTLKITGQAPGTDQVLLVLVDDRGDLTTELSSSSGTNFTETVEVRSPPAGSMNVYAVTIGRDGVVGDGDLPSVGQAATLARLDTYLKTMSPALTPQQVSERLLTETTLDSASDDRVARTRITVSQPAISIEKITRKPMNQTTDGHTIDRIRVYGRTNLRVENVVVQATIQQRGKTYRYAIVTNSTGGQWTTTLPTATLPVGRYTIVVEAKDALDRESVVFTRSPQSSSPTASQSPETTATQSATVTAVPSESGLATTSASPSVSSPDSSPSNTPTTLAAEPTAPVIWSALIITVGLLTAIVLWRTRRYRS